ncbi:MAG: hypothetical protein RIQ68_944, partial [Pseudomonadota bacterium]
MIKYALICDQEHEFESWFPNADAYETQVKRGFVECPQCQSKTVSKALMAPAVSTSRRKEARQQTIDPTGAELPAMPTEAAPVALLDEQQQQIREAIRELHEKLTENSTNVGESFPEEARKMHSGEAPERSIHGRASLEEAKAL